MIKNCSLELEIYRSLHATRTNSLELVNTKCRHDLRKYFSCRIVNIWNLKLLLRHHLIHSKTVLTDSGLDEPRYLIQWPGELTGTGFEALYCANFDE